MKNNWDECKSYIAALAPTGVVVGVSGGPDSMCLLDVFRKYYQGPIYCAHVDHLIRETGSRDTALVEQYCRKHSIPFLTKQVDVPALAARTGQSLEQAGRQARYEFFKTCGQEMNACFTAVAHHLDDQAETVLLNLLRGAGAKGLAAMEQEREGLLRPFLSMEKGTLVAYCEENGIPYATDETNTNTVYVRNYIRHELLPRMEALNPAIRETLTRTAQLLKEDDETLSNLAREALTDMVCTEKEMSLPCAALASQPNAISSRMLRIALGEFGFTRDIEQLHIQQILSLVRSQKNGGMLNLPHHLEAWLAYDRILFVRGGNAAFSPRPVTAGPLETPLGAWEISFSQENRSGERLDADRVKDAIFRPAEKEDFIMPLGMQGHKMLNDYLSDRKVPRPHRERLVVLARGSEVLWVEGAGISQQVRLTESTRNVLTISPVNR